MGDYETDHSMVDNINWGLGHEHYQPRSKKPKSKFSKFIVVISILTILAYTATALYFTWYGKYIPDSLTYSFFAAFAVELSALAGIRIKENKFERRF